MLEWHCAGLIYYIMYTWVAGSRERLKMAELQLPDRFSGGLASRSLYTCPAQAVSGQHKLLVVKPDGYRHLRLADSSSSFCRTYTLTASDGHTVLFNFARAISYTCGIGQTYNPNSEAVHAFFSLGKLIEARSLLSVCLYRSLFSRSCSSSSWFISMASLLAS